MQKTFWRRAVIGGLALATAAVGALAISSSPAAAHKPLLKTTLLDTSGNEIGTVEFTGKSGMVSRVEVQVRASAAPALGDFHGFHVHTTGVCDPAPSGTTNVPFGSAGGHWNPTAASHGAHAGDMPSVLIHASGKGYATFETDRFPVSALLDGDGSAVVLHAGRDNFANIPATYSSGEPPVAGPNAATLGTGDSGGRYACGVVRGVS